VARYRVPTAVTPTASKHRPVLVALAIACAVALTALPATTAASDPPVFHGLGAWVDIFDGPVFSSIPTSVAKMKRKGVQTIYVETANANSGGTMSFEAQQGQLLEAAHDNGIKVVAWTLPGHTSPGNDKAKALAAIGFASPRGDHFDGFALDIESTSVKSIDKRNQRLLTLSAQIKQVAGGMPLGAITFSPVFIDKPWPNFPWQQLATTYDAFLPMAYSSYHYNTGNEVRTYTKRAVQILREKTSPTEPIHVIGGIADAMSGGETRGFVRAVLRTGVAGGSLYDFRTSGKEDWKYLKRL
jgi:hypothetical protein